MDWLIDNWIEVFGAFSALVYLFFSIRQSIFLWPVGLVASLVYIYVYYSSAFYADMSLQFYYVVVSVYGWFFWKNKQNKEDKNELSIQKTPLKLAVKLFIIFIILFFLMSKILLNWTDSPLPYWDSFTTSASFIATWMLTKKYIEQWIIWIIVDFVSLILYFYKGLYPTAILFIIYTIMAIIGYFKWKKYQKILK